VRDPDPVRGYYASRGEREWDRLENPTDGAIEWALTTRRIARHLTVPGRVLDIGGGPGRYTIWLAQQGHQVVLADLSPELLSIARTKVQEAGVGERVETIAEADACDLSSWDDGVFDAALCLGPFYHLPDAGRRQQAARELARVLRPGGVAFVAFMPRLTLLARTIAIAEERRHLEDRAWLQALLERGEFTNDVSGRFNGGYGVRPQDVAPFMESFGFETLSLSSAESVTRGLQEAVAEIAAEDAGLHARVIDLLDEVAEEPSALGLANHLLYIGRRS
jgi:S-adenosylmethionine-dependent methyltransferase